MQTPSRTRTWVSNRRRGGGGEVGRAELHADLSPVWEVLPRGHQEVGARRVVLQRDARLRRGLALLDLSAAFAAVLLVINVIDANRVTLTPGAVLIVPFVLVAAKVIGLYDRDQHVLSKTTIDELPSIFYLAVLYSLFLWLCEVALFHGWLQRPQVFGLLVMTFALMSVGRLIGRKAGLAMTRPERCIVIGNAKDAARIAAKFDDVRSVNAMIVGRVALQGDDPDDMPSTVEKLGSYGTMARVVAEHDVERAIIAPSSDGQESILDAIRLIKALGVKVSVVPRLLEVVGSTSTFDDLDGLWLLGVQPYGLARSSELLKRGMDVAAAGLGLVVLGPLFVMLTLAVKLDSRGPVFFRQRRIGRRGATFSMLKFRSMVDGADGMKDEVRSLNEVHGGLFKISADPRITRVGRLLRRTLLDELPQLINVLRGDMSLVGPRPLVPDEDALIEGWQRRRLAVKPGMTGLWQIFGSSRIPMNEMVKIDYIYGANWSLWLDLRILLRTIPYMLSRRGL